MAEFDLQGVFSADASEYVSAAEESADASAEVADETDEAADSLFEVDAAGVAAGAGLAAAGTAAQSSLDSTRDMREELGRAAVTAGNTQDEMVDLAASVTDGTFPIEDASGAIGSLVEQGVHGEEQLRELALASDTLADATGESAEVIASDLGPVMEGLGDDVEDMEDVQDAVALAVNETNLEFGDLTRTMERSREELNDLGLGTEEAAGLMAAYAEETGLSGRELRREFSSALDDADGDLENLNDTLGVGQEDLADFQAHLEENEGAAEEYASVVDENTTLMDDLRASFGAAQLQIAEYLGPLNAAAPALQAAGGAAVFFSTVNTTALIPSVTGLTAVSAPLLATVGAIAVAVGALGFAIHNDWIDPMETATAAASVAGDAIAWVKDNVDTLLLALGPLGLAVRGIREAWAENFGGIRDITSRVVDAIVNSIDWLIEKINVIPGVEIPTIDSDDGPGEDPVEFDDTPDDPRVPDPGDTAASPPEPEADLDRPDAGGGDVETGADGDRPASPGRGSGPVEIVLELTDGLDEFVDARIEESDRDAEIDVFARGRGV